MRHIVCIKTLIFNFEEFLINDVENLKINANYENYSGIGAFIMKVILLTQGHLMRKIMKLRLKEIYLCWLTMFGWFSVRIKDLLLPLLSVVLKVDTQIKKLRSCFRGVR